MKLNRMICPNCGHETLTDCAYTCCDSCQTMFYAAQSARPSVYPAPCNPFVNPAGATIIRGPTIVPGATIIRGGF